MQIPTVSKAIRRRRETRFEGRPSCPWRYDHIHGLRKAGSWRNGSAQAAHGNKEPQASGGGLAIVGRELYAVVVAGD